jgi:hypothetical protein
MTIDFSNLRKYERIILKLFNPAMPVEDKGYLDFQAMKFTFGSKTKGYGQIDIDVVGYVDERPFYVDIQGLLNVIASYPVLELSGFQFNSGENQFELQHLEEPYGYPPFEMAVATSLKLTKDFLKNLVSCMSVVDVSGSLPSLSGVFVKNGYIWGTDKKRLYEKKLPTDWDGVELALPFLTCEILAFDLFGETVSLASEVNSFKIAGEGISLSLPLLVDLQSPDIQSDSFRRVYNHENYVVVGKAQFTEAVKFLDGFVKSLAGQRIRMRITDTQITLYTNDFNRIEIKIPVVETSPNQYFTGDDKDSITISNAQLKSILSVLSGESVKVQINLEKPAMNFSIQGSEADHFVSCRLPD